MAERDSDYLVIAPFAWTNTGSSISSSNSSKSVESWVCQNWANSWIESVLGNPCAFIVSSSRCKRAVANLCRALAGEHLLGQRRNRNAMVTDVPLAPRSGVEDPRRRVVGAASKSPSVIMPSRHLHVLCGSVGHQVRQEPFRVLGSLFRFLEPDYPLGDRSQLLG